MYVCTHVFVSDHVHAMSEYNATLFVNQIGISDTHTHTRQPMHSNSSFDNNGNNNIQA